MKNKTAEEVYVEMLKPAEAVTLKVQHRPDDFSMLKDVAGDGFYIRYIPTNTCTQIVNVFQLCQRVCDTFPLQALPIMFQICCVTAAMLITPQI